jgi:hypothetical protein
MIQKGCTGHPAAVAPPAYRGDTSDHPFAPTKPLSAGPHAGIPPGRPRGRWQAAAYGPRVEGPDPADTPTNGGSRRVAPSRNLSFRDGQRPTIHRLQRCRGPRGPRASVTVAHTVRADSGTRPTAPASSHGVRANPGGELLTPMAGGADTEARRTDGANRTAAVGDDPRGWNGDRAGRNPTTPDPERSTH